VNVASLYPDPKTFVDKPTNKPPSSVLSDFAAIPAPRTNGALTQFVNDDFRGEGLELAPLSLQSFNPNPSFLNGVADTTLRAWSGTVHGYWTQLVRGTRKDALCDGEACESSLIPLNHTFVVPGGRFREQCASSRRSEPK
jgi:alpha,alpha-trehalase